MENLGSVDYIIVLTLISVIFLLLLRKNFNQTHAIFPKNGKLLNLSLNEIYSMKEDLSTTTFPFLSRMILFYDVKQELLLRIENSMSEKKFLSNLTKCIEVIYDYDFSSKKIASLINIIFPRYYWKILAEIESYEKPEKPYVITLLMKYSILIKDKRLLFFIKDRLRLRLACLIAKSEKPLKDQTKLIALLGDDELQIIHKFKAA